MDGCSILTSPIERIGPLIKLLFLWWYMLCWNSTLVLKLLTNNFWVGIFVLMPAICCCVALNCYKPEICMAFFYFSSLGCIGD
jgi:hypothetical protein